MTIKLVLKRQLKNRKTTVKALRNNPELKNRILNELVQEGAKEGKSQARITKEIRSEGISFSNEVVRQLYRKTTKVQPHKTVASYFKRLRNDVLPNPDKLLEIEFNKPKAEYYYGFRIWGIERGLKTRNVSAKHGAKRGTKYSTTAEIGLWSDELLTKKEAIRQLKRLGVKGIRQNGSDPDEITSKHIKITHVRIVKLLRVA